MEKLIEMLKELLGAGGDAQPERDAIAVEADKRRDPLRPGQRR
ncbi:hypothetical protein [Cognatishimia sp. F0-27]|nr:hypothetical protein [Cognatishimia sp. F0-27]